MGKYRTATVKVSDIGGRGNKIYHSGDIVNETSFPPGNFEKLLKGGYIEEITETESNDQEELKTGEALADGESREGLEVPADGVERETEIKGGAEEIPAEPEAEEKPKRKGNKR